MKKRVLPGRGFFMVFCCVLSVHTGLVQAQAATDAADSSFAVPKGLSGRVEFWKNMFVKYGKDQRVFHHREHPEIVYSVLDLSQYENTLSGKELLQARRSEVDRETIRIQEALKSLAAAGKAITPFERRIEKQFTIYGINSAGEYLHAAEPEFIRYQAGIKERFREGVVRSGRYLYAIEQIFRAEGLPVELGRLPLVESSFDYEAYSSAGAAGIWQFMRTTGTRYMRIDAVLDERRDPIVATRAAAKYLKNAYSYLQSWPLAVTSYNHGLAGIIRASKETGSKDLRDIIDRYNGRTFGFASKNFYCEFLAAVEVERNAERYFPGIKREARLQFDEVKLGRSLSFRELQRASSSTKDELTWLNRAFRDPIISGRVSIPKGYVVRVPPGKGAVVRAAVSGSSGIELAAPESMNETLRDHRKSRGVQTYTTRPGDSVASIARRYGVSRSALIQANKMTAANKLRAGKTIVIPEEENRGDKPVVRKGSRKGSLPAAKKAAPEKKTAAAETGKRQKSYTVSAGDNLSVIAKKTGVPLAKLKRLNPGAGAALKPGQTLALD